MRDHANVMILNPGSGSSQAAEVVKAAAALGIQVQRTRKPGDGVWMAQQAAREGARTVVAAGGDGTIHEVVSGLLGLGQSPPCLGVVPLGTGNDFARNVGLPLDPLLALDTCTGTATPIDVIRLDTDGRRTVCMNALNGGFSGELADNLTDELKERWGRLSYLRAATESLTDLTTYEVHLELDGEPPETHRAYNVAIANGPAVGGGFPIAPEARPWDGMADVVLVRPATIARLTTLLPAVLTGAEPDSELFQSWRARRGRIFVTPELPFSLDGEVDAAAEIRFEVLRGALKVCGIARPEPASR